MRYATTETTHCVFFDFGGDVFLCFQWMIRWSQMASTLLVQGLRSLPLISNRMQQGIDWGWRGLPIYVTSGERITVGPWCWHKRCMHLRWTLCNSREESGFTKFLDTSEESLTKNWGSYFYSSLSSFGLHYAHASQKITQRHCTVHTGKLIIIDQLGGNGL